MSQVLGVEVIIEEGESVCVSVTETRTSAKRGSQVAGAVIGGVIAGGPGLIVGGLSGKKRAESTGTATTTQLIQGVGLRIVVDDVNRPNHIIYFGKSIQRGSSPFNSALNEANEWHALLSVLIRRNTQQTLTDKTDSDRTEVQIEICKNCDRKIGRLEKACVFNDEIVCSECYNRLK